MLLPHPDNPAGLRQEVTATLARRPDDALTVGYAIRGDTAALHLPTAAAPAPADALWRTTCCELFVASGDGSYREFNFSPSGQWAAYDFRAYRERAAAEAAIPAPAISLRHDSDALHLDATLPAAALPAGRLRLGVCAVLATQDGRVGWWALAHAPGRPDFHHAAAYALTLDEDTP